ncbi:hypothetical protein [Polaribacter sp.]|uniref:hypothetical protein n=1 Tax=Polaribacter sp. TaxID=1920175 RepID=UPI003EF6D12D
MEYKKHLCLVLFTTFFLCSAFLSAQESLVCFYKKGEISKRSKNQENNFKIGQLLYVKDSILVADKAEVTLIDNLGNTYKIANKRNYSFADAVSLKNNAKTESTSKKYLKYVYAQFMNIEEKETVSGGVYRGKELMYLPDNYAFINQNSFVDFKWKNPGIKTFFLIIRDQKNKKIISKYKLNSTSLGVQLNNKIYKKNSLYEWTILTDEFADLKKLPFYAFKIVSDKEHKKLENNADYNAKKVVDFILKTKE